MPTLSVKNLLTNETSMYDSFPRETVIEKKSEQLFISSSISDSRIILEEGAKLIFILAGTEGWMGSTKLSFEFRGANTEVMFLGFIIGTREQNFIFETVSHHLAHQTKAHYFLRAAMFDESSVDYKGNLIIEKTAQLADTYLAHHTLLLSEKARARTIPALEIEADDVKAGHAATIGKVDRELLFYLKSRGIPEEVATEMLIQGFFESQLAMIPDEPTRQMVREKLMMALPFTTLEPLSIS